MRIPSFLARKLYVKGSLRNSPHGFQGEMKNAFAPGTIWEMVSLEVYVKYRCGRRPSMPFRAGRSPSLRQGGYQGYGGEP